MKKKSICGILIAAMLCSLCPSAAFAAETSLKTIEKPLDFRNATENQEASDGTWEWNAGSQTLTLYDLRVEVPVGKLEEKAVIMLPAESTLEIEGSHNKIYSKGFHCSAVYCEGDLYVSGDGYLEVKTESYGAAAFYVKQGPLVFEEKVQIDVDPAGYIIYMEYVKGKDAVLTVQDDAVITFPDSSVDRNITLTHRKTVEYTRNWLNYAEIHDLDSRTVSLVDVSKKPVKNQKPVETPIEEPTAPAEPAKSEYQITIGNPELLKDGAVGYTADVAPYLSNGFTMLPLRALLEISNPDLEIKWNSIDQSVYTYVDQRRISIKLGDDFYQKVTTRIPLSTPAEMKDGRIFISLRDWMNIMELEESQLDWNSETKTVTLTY